MLGYMEQKSKSNYLVHFTTSGSDWNHDLKCTGIPLVIGPLFIDIIDFDVYI